MNKELLDKIKTEKKVLTGGYVYEYKKDDINYIIRTPENQVRYKYIYPELIQNQILWVR